MEAKIEREKQKTKKARMKKQNVKNGNGMLM
jgi:hypothetical protein